MCAYSNLNEALAGYMAYSEHEACLWNLLSIYQAEMFSPWL